MSTSQQDYLYRVFFKLKLHESSGDGFQALFSRLMAYAKPGFQAVSPWGNWGDGGNDGWVESELHYYQVFGPKPNSNIKEFEVVRKAVEDFDKLIEKWGSVQKYSFVMNDRFQGIPAPVGAALLKLKQDKSLLHSAAMGGDELMRLFMGLVDDQRQDIVGYIPPEAPDFIDSRAVGELLSFLAEKSVSNLDFLNEDAPDFDVKIDFNGLSKRVGVRLESNSYQVFLIDDFLESIGEDYKQSISKEVRDIYEESKLVIPDSIESFSDMRYFWMVDSLIPPEVKSHPQQMSGFRMAAEIVLAKYFETCDAYENPDNVIAS
ncbi:ABC-three component system protein [Halomonas sp. H10-9-1]|uniref:ABC-three component system protein n=1 Tax=Halomonas sp. H10-9-1 TaxID=2950871 RepID=UPI0032E03669